MTQAKVAKVMISLPRGLLEVADRLAKEWSTTRSGVIAQLIDREEEARIKALMIEGYKARAEENRSETEEWLKIPSEVAPREPYNMAHLPGG